MTMFEPIKPGQQFGHGEIQFRRDALIEVDLHQQRNQFGRFVNVNSGRMRLFDDGLRQQTSSLR